MSGSHSLGAHTVEAGARCAGRVRTVRRWLLSHTLASFGPLLTVLSHPLPFLVRLTNHYQGWEVLGTWGGPCKVSDTSARGT